MMPWYAEGLRFECTQCGRCCSGSPGYVLFTEDEARAIAARLGIAVDEFVRRFTRDLGIEIAGRRRSLVEIETEHGLDCVFLDRAGVSGATRCSIHDVRPMQCRTFPFWPEHLASEREWQRLGRACEGIGRGGVVPLTKITIERAAYERDRSR